MHFSRSLVATALAGFACATTHMGEEPAMTGVVSSITLASQASPAEATGAAEMGMVNTHVVEVGGSNGSLSFFPENVAAQPGDLVQFQFHPKNHSVVQSTFDQPCVPIQNVMPNKTDAFFSGFMPTNASLAATSQILTYTIRVMDEKPVWFYCSQGKHCQSGMVGAINAPASGNKTMDNFKSLAAEAAENVTPGQAAGSGAAGSPEASAAPSGGAAGTGAGGAGEAGATGTAGTSPAEQTASGADVLSRQHYLSVGLGAVAAFMVL